MDSNQIRKVKKLIVKRQKIGFGRLTLWLFSGTVNDSSSLQVSTLEHVWAAIWVLDWSWFSSLHNSLEAF